MERYENIASTDGANGAFCLYAHSLEPLSIERCEHLIQPGRFLIQLAVLARASASDRSAAE